MKNKQLVILFLISMVLVIVGALFKIMHWPGANMLLMIGLVAEAICVILLIGKLIKGNNNSSFLDS